MLIAARSAIVIAVDKNPRFNFTSAFRASLPALLLIGTLAAGIPGCASLPDFKHVVARQQPSDTETEGIRNSAGPLCPDEGIKILEDLQHRVSATDMLAKYVQLMPTVTGKPMVMGNRVTLLVDEPATYRAMLRAIDGARDHVNLESFKLMNDPGGRRFAESLTRKSAGGVEVNIIYDSAGSWDTSPAFFGRLEDSGIQVLEYNPLNPLKAHTGWTFTTRDHRKILVVDGLIAFTGGINIAGKYRAGLAQRATRAAGRAFPWRDTDIQIEGPAVAELQELFMRTWAGQCGKVLVGREYFPAATQEGDDLVQVVGSSRGSGHRDTYLMYLAAIHFSERSIHLTDAYFAPDEQIVGGLCDAAKRGVDVEIVLPRLTDHNTVLNAGRYYYSRLLRSGVKLYERRNLLLHAKTAVVDGIWSTVGSTNLDMWSSLRNDEVNVVIVSPSFAGQMATLFASDLDASTPIRLEKWESRSFSDRLKEWFAHLFAYWF
jgi:cardiolipin synthase A/B